MIVALRTDKPEAELYLFDDSLKEVDRFVWQAHRTLSVTLLTKLDELLSRHALTPADLSGLVSYQGPGSFTGLRIGISVMNTLAYSLRIPHTGGTGEEWQSQGFAVLASRPSTTIVIPDYGAEALITRPRK